MIIVCGGWKCSIARLKQSGRDALAHRTGLNKLEQFFGRFCSKEKQVAHGFQDVAFSSDNVGIIGTKGYICEKYGISLFYSMVY
jgi:hypothetical protein